MKIAPGFLYFVLLVLAVAIADERATDRAVRQTTALGDYTKYVAAKIIKNVKTSCDSPGI